MNAKNLPADIEQDIYQKLPKVEDALIGYYVDKIEQDIYQKLPKVEDALIGYYVDKLADILSPAEIEELKEIEMSKYSREEIDREIDKAIEKGFAFDLCVNHALAFRCGRHFSFKKAILASPYRMLASDEGLVLFLKRINDFWMKKE